MVVCISGFAHGAGTLAWTWLEGMSFASTVCWMKERRRVIGRNASSGAATQKRERTLLESSTASGHIQLPMALTTTEGSSKVHTFTV